MKLELYNGTEHFSKEETIRFKSYISGNGIFCLDAVDSRGRLLAYILEISNDVTLTRMESAMELLGLPGDHLGRIPLDEEGKEE